MPLLPLRRKNLHFAGFSRHTGPGDSQIPPWDVLHSCSSEYELQRFRFRGCFSDVAECKHVATKEIMAVKILKKRAYHTQQPIKELAMLNRIRGLDPDNLVRFLEGFEYQGYTCLAFEMLDKNLHELLKERRHNMLSLQEIQPIAQQLLTALESLKTAGIIHADIKPHNIMLVKQQHQPFRVKLIDFGSAVPAAEVKRGVIMQPIGYRSPDVILGLPITAAVDMWSLGGVLATMYLGTLPFPQRCQYYLMKKIVETLGPPEDEVLSDGAYTLLYFSPNQDSTKPAWRLKTADEYKAVTGFPPHQHNGGRSSWTRFDRLFGLVILYPVEDFKHRIMFVHLLRAMLHMNPQKRITPSRALMHSFLTQRKPDDDVDTSYLEMVSGATTSVSPVVKSAEEVEISVASSHTDEEPIDDGASATVSSTDVASAAIQSSQLNKDSAAGVDNLPAVCSNDEASDAAAGSTDDDEAAVKPASTEASTSPVTADQYGATSADNGVTATSITGASPAPPAIESDDAVNSTSTTEVHFGPLIVSISCDGVSDSGNTQRTLPKRIRRFCGRLCWALCCCCAKLE